jgi:hypothetical protein
MERGSIQGDSLSPLLLLYIEPLPGGSTSAGVDTDSPPTKDRTRHQISALAYADDLNCHDDGLRPTRAGTKLNTLASEFSLPMG